MGKEFRTVWHSVHEVLGAPEAYSLRIGSCLESEYLFAAPTKAPAVLGREQLQEIPGEAALETLTPPSYKT